MTLPNLITTGRLLIVPLVVVMIGQGQWATAFLLFVAAGASDAVDGFIARRFDMRSEFGAYIDAVADKALLVSIYVSLAVVGVLPGWLAIVVVSRDIMIIGAIIISWLMGRPVAIQPLTISKLNTAVQIAFAALFLFKMAFGFELGRFDLAAMWVVAALTAALVLAVAALYVLRGILLPFVAGLALAYLLDPLADRFERMGIGRLGATLLILVLFVLAFVLALVLLVPLLFHQVQSFVDRLPEYVDRLQALLVEQGRPLLERLGGREALADVQSSAGDLVKQGGAWLLGFLRGLWSGGQALIGVFALLVVTPVVAFYILVDWDRMIGSIDAWVPVRNRETVRRLAREINQAIAGFIRGQALVCLILGTFYAVALAVIGLNFGALIGMTAGFLSFIPYVGSLTGLLVSVGMALVQFWPDWTWILATLGIFVAGQFFEGNILSPKLVGASVGLHPVWLMFALFAFGSLFGFVGLLLAVPLAAAVGVLARFALQSYLASPLYHGGSPALVPPAAAALPPGRDD